MGKDLTGKELGKGFTQRKDGRYQTRISLGGGKKPICLYGHTLKEVKKKREKLYEEITKEAISYGVAIIDQNEIDRINILNATKHGLTTSIKELKVKPDIILVDALTKIDTCGIPYNSIIKGDAKSYSIAAASIIAKVTRDRIMRQWDEVYPQYGFAKHKGYGTAAHIAAIKENGICPLHRLSFVKKFI